MANNPITLKDFEKKYFPKNSKTELAKKFGVSISIHSKILHSEYSTSSPEFKKVEEFVARYGYKLIRDKNEEKLKKEYEQIVIQKDEEIHKLLSEINSLKNEIKMRDIIIENYETINKCVNFIYEEKQRLRGKRRKCNS